VHGGARRGLVACVASLALGAAVAPAAWAQVQLVPFGGQTYAAPRHVAAPPADTARVFVVQSNGVIRLVNDGTTEAAPFLDINAEVCDGSAADGCGGEAGMFSIAFAPDYAESGLFYVFFTRAVSASAHELVIKELRATNPDDADEASGRDVLVIPHPVNRNHNGGQLQFGPDGFLYIATGDGGGANDPRNNAQDLASRLGKLLRIDPADPPGAAQYSVPPDNPFRDGTGPNADEIYAYGLRNPYRFSFDRLTGDLAIGDVGQAAWEEIDFVPNGAGRGANFGWDCFEGTALALSATKIPPDPQCAPPPAGHTPPVLRYARPPGGAAVNGGFVVRDENVPGLLGRYLYADSSGALPGNAIFSAVLSPGGAVGNAPTGLSAPFVVSFGEDACGRVYVVSGGGQVSRIQSGPGTPACNPQTSPSPQTPPSPPAGGSASDAQAPGLDLEVVRGRRAARSGEILLRLTCSESCSVSATADFRVPGRNFDVGPERASLAAGAPQELALPLSRAQARRLRGVLHRGRKAKALIEAVATDAAGNRHSVGHRLPQKR
jgi:glucose/arabinose dehydrogenase